MEEKNNKIKIKKVGFKTLGVLLIVFGILFGIQVILKIDILRYILLAWPIVLVALGIEILAADRKSQVKISVGSIFLIMLLIGVSFLFGALNVLINNILYNDEIINDIIDNDRMFYISDQEEISVINYTDKDITLTIIEDDSLDARIFTDIEYNLESNVAALIQYINGDFYSIYMNNDSIEVYEISDSIEKVNIKVITKDKTKISTKGNIEVVYN